MRGVGKIFINKLSHRLLMGRDGNDTIRDTILQSLPLPLSSSHPVRTGGPVCVLLIAVFIVFETGYIV